MATNRGTLGKVSGTCSVLTIIAIMMANYGDEFRTSVDGLEIIGNAEGVVANHINALLMF